MRRKGLLLAILATFLASSILSYNVFRSSATDHPVEYISIHHWGGEEIEVPHTGGVPSSLIIAVLQPHEVTNLPLYRESEQIASDVDTNSVPDPVSDPIDASTDPTDVADENTDSTTSTDASETLPADSADDTESEPAEAEDSAAATTAPDPTESDASVNVLSPAETVLTNPGDSTVQATSSTQDWGYLIFLVVIGLIVAGFGTYFFEQHFWR